MEPVNVSEVIQGAISTIESTLNGAMFESSEKSLQTCRR